MIGEFYRTTEGGDSHRYSFRCTEEEWAKMRAASELYEALKQLTNLREGKDKGFSAAFRYALIALDKADTIK